MKNFGYLVAAYSAIWLLISWYFVSIGSKTEALSKKVEILKNEIFGDKE